MLPDRQVGVLPGHEVILIGGVFHCVTQQ